MLLKRVDSAYLKPLAVSQQFMCPSLVFSWSVHLNYCFFWSLWHMQVRDLTFEEVPRTNRWLALALRHLIYRRLRFNLHLKNSNSGLTMNDYLQLFTMAAINIIWGVALAFYNLYLSSSGRLRSGRTFTPTGIILVSGRGPLCRRSFIIVRCWHGGPCQCHLLSFSFPLVLV